MRKFYILVSAVLLSVSLWGQAPQKMSYQAVIRGANNALVIDKPVGVRISILQGSETGSTVYTETHTPTTNANGLASLSIGAGKNPSSDFAKIDWSKGPYFVKTETDVEGGTNYQLTAVSELMSVPFALYAANSQPGPKGDKGEPGIQGPAGKDGVDGKDGISSPNYWNKEADSSISYNGVKVGTRNNLLVNGYQFNRLTSDSREVQGVTTYIQSTPTHTNWLIGSKNIVFGQGKGYHIGVLGSGGKDLNYVLTKNARYGVVGMSTDTLSTIEYNNGLYGFASGHKKMNFGIDGTGGSSVGDNYGVSGWAWGKTSGINYGLYGYASQSSSANYAVYGEVDKSVVSGIKYSGYFKGAPLGVADDNIYVKDFNKGVVLTSPDGGCHQVKVDNSGSLTVIKIDCPK
jgi:hypothetical protein